MSTTESKQAITYTITWINLGDACEKCQILALTPFLIDGELPPTLDHPIYGPVWDFMSDISLVHPNCRCMLDIQVDVDLNVVMIGGGTKGIEMVSVEGIKMVSVEEAKIEVSDLKQQLQDLEPTYGQLRTEEMLITRILYLTAASTTDESQKKVMLLTAKFLTMARMAEFTLRQIQLLEAGAGPFGWIMLGTAAVTTVLGAEMMMRQP